MRAFLLYSALWFLTQVALFGAPENVQAGRSATELPDSERIMTAFPRTDVLPLSTNSQDLIEWPAAETRNAEQVRVDRSKTLPPAYREPKKRDAKPIRLGAVTPQAARSEAEQWIRRVLKPEWLPEDLASRMYLLQREPASQSVIVCRYVIDGHAIQITQDRSSMWVIIKPPRDTTLNRDASAIAKEFFPAYFLMGDRMAAVKQTSTNGTAKLRAWVPDYSASIPPGALENWWGWRLWATDGKAVAVFLAKTSEDSAHTVTSDEPWF